MFLPSNLVPFLRKSNEDEAYMQTSRTALVYNITRATIFMTLIAIIVLLSLKTNVSHYEKDVFSVEG